MSMKKSSAEVKFSTLFLIFASSMLVVGIMLAGGLYSLNKGAFVQSVIEEFSRCIFCYAAFKITRHLISASIAFSFSEIIFSSLVNLLIFNPTYLTEMSSATIIAYASITCSAIIGVIAGFIYKENAIRGYSIFWGVFLTFPMKYILRSFPNGFISKTYGSTYDLHFYLIYPIFLSFILFILFKRR
jgi:hypothetical protein